MTHKEFLNELQKSCHADHHQCASLLNALIKLMAQAAIDQISVTLPGLGTFNSHKHPEYIQEDQQTGQQTLYPPRISYRMQPYNPQTDNGESGIVQELAEYTSLEIQVADTFIRCLVDTVVSHLQKHDDVEIHGLGLFHIIETHQTQLHRIAYTPDEQMREMVNAPFNCFEPVVITKGREAEPIILEEPETTESEKEQESPISDDDETVSNNIDQTINDNIDQAISNDVVQTELVNEEQCETAEGNTEEPEDEEQPVKTVQSEETQASSNDTRESQVMANEEPKLKPEIIEEEEKTLILQHPCKPFPWKRICLYASIFLIVIICSTVVVYFIKNRPAPPPVMADVGHKATPAIMINSNPKTDTIAESNIEDTIKQEVVPIINEKQEQVVEAEIQKSLPVVSEPKQPSSDKVAPKAEMPAIKQEKVVKQETKPQSQQIPKVFHRLKGADGQPITVMLNQGERLTIVSLNQYGDKAFWPYIFEVNSDRLKAPNLVQAGMKLYLPDPAFYHIDVNDAESLRKAKNKGAQLLNNMK